MKKIIIVPLLFFCLTLPAATYYVSTTGNDAAAGTLAAPWLTWNKGFSTPIAGDTVYFRGGVYSVLSGQHCPTIDNNGTLGNEIYLLNYPAEVPILDCTNRDVYEWGAVYYGVAINGEYLVVKGLTVRNLWQQLAGEDCFGFGVGSSNSVIENCTAYNIGGTGFYIGANINIQLINCDAYNCSDLLGDPSSPGNDGYGFHVNNDVTNTSTTYFKKCRAWKCGDDGFAYYTNGYIENDSCWSFMNGQLEGGGSGIKLGFLPETGDKAPLLRKVINCIVAFNRENGLGTNDNSLRSINCQIYNNTSYHNGYHPSNLGYGYGFMIFNTSESDELELERIFKNNISYNNAISNLYVAGSYTHSNNSWDASPSVTVTDADFISVDSTGLSGARQADGSLPDIDFLKLASTSDLINKGIDVGLPYVGSYPDIGFDEYAVPDDPIDPVVVYITGVYEGTNRALVGCMVNDDGGGTVSERGVCWSVSENPTTADGHTSDGTGTGTFISNITGLSRNTTYHVRAYATNEAGTAYGADVQFTTKKSSNATHGGKPLFSGSKIVIIQ